MFTYNKRGFRTLAVSAAEMKTHSYKERHYVEFGTLSVNFTLKGGVGSRPVTLREYAIATKST